MGSLLGGISRGDVGMRTRRSADAAMKMSLASDSSRGVTATAVFFLPLPLPLALPLVFGTTTPLGLPLVRVLFFLAETEFLFFGLRVDFLGSSELSASSPRYVGAALLRLPLRIVAGGLSLTAALVSGETGPAIAWATDIVVIAGDEGASSEVGSDSLLGRFDSPSSGSPSWARQK